jgi:PAS domain S-box-containing protein
MVEVSTLLIDLEDKKYYKSIIRDITERKKLEIQLTAERYQLRTIIDASPASIWFKDTHNNFIHVNKAAARIANRRVNEIEGKPTDEIFPVESDKYFTDDLEVINSGKPKLNIIESVTVGDKVRWVRTDKIPWLDTNHKIAGVIAFALDITNVIQYGKKIKMLAQAVESVSECVTITDMKDKIIFVNKAFIQTYGFSKEELIGKNIKIVRPQLPNTTYDEILRETLKGGWKGELINMKKDGTVFPVHLSTSVIKDEKDNPVALIGIVFDITKLKNQMNTF